MLLWYHGVDRFEAFLSYDIIVVRRRCLVVMKTGKERERRVDLEAWKLIQKRGRATLQELYWDFPFPVTEEDLRGSMERLMTEGDKPVRSKRRDRSGELVYEPAA